MSKTAIPAKFWIGLLAIFVLGVVGDISTIWADEPLDVYEISDTESNSWSRSISYQLENMLPSSAQYIEYEVRNVGAIAANFFVVFDNFTFEDTIVSEPECDAEGGTYTSPAGPCTGRSAEYELDKWINYDLIVDVYDSSDDLIETRTIYVDSDNIKFDTLEDTPIYVSLIPSGYYIQVSHSYHLVSGADNQFQGDKLIFDMNMYAESAIKGETDEGDGGGRVLGASTGSDLGIAARIVSLVLLTYIIYKIIRIFPKLRNKFLF